MSLIPNLSEIPDIELAPEGEYELQIISAKEITSEKTGRTGIQLVCKFVDEENVGNLFHSLWFPMDGDDEQKANTMWRMIKEFLQALKMPLEIEDISEFMHVEFSALVTVKDYEGKTSNEIKRVLGE